MSDISKGEKTKQWLKDFFINYVWIGISLLFASIIIDTNYPSPTRSLWLSILLKAIEDFGLAIIIAAIFSYASGTAGFVERIRKLLEDIIVRRNFLANIDPAGKKDALKALIQPSASEINKYPNIGDYYGYFINNTLEISKKNVRSNYQVESRAYLDQKSQKIAVDGIYSYRLYPSTEGFNDIDIAFEDPEDSGSFCSYIRVNDSNGERFVSEKPKLDSNKIGGFLRGSKLSAREFGSQKSHLDVEIKVTEYGIDHWSLLQFQALQPTDGFRFHLRCDDGIKIRKHSVFVVGAKFNIDIDDSKQEILITCNQWINAGSGLCVLISIPQASEVKPSHQNTFVANHPADQKKGEPVANKHTAVVSAV